MENTCSKCQGLGWVAAKGYRFYGTNGRLCDCGLFATVAEVAAFADEIRDYETAVRQLELTRTRAARRAARQEAN